MSNELVTLREALEVSCYELSEANSHAAFSHMKEALAILDRLQAQESRETEPVAELLGDPDQVQYASMRVRSHKYPSGTKLYTSKSALSAMLDVDTLANIIRFADGENKLGAGELAERIIGVMALAGKQTEAEG